MSDSRRWLEAFADDIGKPYDELMARAGAYLLNGSHWVGGAEFEGLNLPAGFWHHYQVATGTLVPAEDQMNFFTCACG